MPVTQDPSLRSMKTLPVRVTGIVFWGLLVIGLIVVLTMLNGRENQIHQRHQAAVDRFMADMYHQLALKPLTEPEQLGELARRLTAGSGSISSVVVEAGGRSIRLGEYTPDMVSYTRPVLLGAGDRAGQQALVTLSLPSIEREVSDERKALLLGMGGLFLMFGLILQRVLDRVLTRPFQQMVGTARAFSSGDEAVRFDEQRNDEFGYLGRFTNQALDYATEQKNALHSALERAQKSESELFEEKEKAVVTLHSIGDAVITTDEHGRVAYMNPVAEELLGWSLEDIRQSSLSKVMRLIDEDSGKPLLNPVDLCLESREKVIGEGHKLLVRHDGQQVPIADSAAPILDQMGHLIGVVMVFHDVGHARKLARQLSYQARHDPLTGLYNRREFENQLAEMLESARSQGRQHAVCYIDLDQFKVVNDICGHSAGDELLRQLAEILHTQVREADILARLGGDEFGVLLTHCNVEQAIRIAENIRSEVRDFRFLYEDRSFKVGASIGIVAITRESHSTSELMSAADIACYAAKDSGRNRVHLYEPSDGEVTDRRGEMNWVSVIRDTLDQGRFYFLFQPVIPLTSRADRSRPSHYELLLRMRDTLGNEILPMAFIPAAERYGLMAEIDRWVVSSAMQLFEQPEQVPAEGIFLIKLSGQSLCDQAFVDFVEQAIARAKLPATRLCFEISEASAISHLRSIGGAIQQLRGLGCRFGLDNFGSGLSSFGYLKNMQIDYVKIDGSFVRDMAHDEMDAAMVRAINEIGHVMGVQTIAKFVETEEILESLYQLGVNFGQGHCIASPRPVEELFRATGHQPSLTLIQS
ncbi:MAG TPA: EAL domain-containing protein [Gammaproteobacteria bacterium]|nr:EAL domain-containing protein [Gammaproteobacteria bacterium]